MFTFTPRSIIKFLSKNIDPSGPSSVTREVQHVGSCLHGNWCCRPREARKKSGEHGDRCGWVRVTFHKHEKTGVATRGCRKKKKKKKKRASALRTCRNANMHMQHQAWSSIVPFMLGRLTGIGNPGQYLYQKSVLLRATLRELRYIRSGTPRAHPRKPFKPSGCNAPITVCERRLKKKGKKMHERER